MKPVTTNLRRAAGFTMIEIALSLAIIGFALVAIIGILPMGLSVQKNNRHETIINQDANFLIEALRSGSRGLNDLTNYVAAITITRNGTNYYYLNPNPIFSGFPLPTGMTPDPLQLTSGAIIIGLLSTPNWGANSSAVAYVQAISGAASEKAPQNNDIIRSAAFSYRLVMEISSYGAGKNYDPTWVNGNNLSVLVNTGHNLHDVRLLFRWPLLPGHNNDGTPKVGNGRQVYRYMVSGNITNDVSVANEAFFFQPQNFVR